MNYIIFIEIEFDLWLIFLNLLITDCWWVVRILNIEPIDIQDSKVIPLIILKNVINNEIIKI